MLFRRLPYCCELIVLHKNRECLSELYAQKIKHGIGRIEKLSAEGSLSHSLVYFAKAAVRHFVTPFVDLLLRKNSIELTSYILLTNAFFWIGKLSALLQIITSILTMALDRFVRQNGNVSDQHIEAGNIRKE